MCLAIPMKVIKVNAPMATVELETVVRDIRADFIEDLKEGEYVLVHAGMAIERVRPEEAEETLKLIRTLGDEIC